MEPKFVHIHVSILSYDGLDWAPPIGGDTTRPVVDSAWSIPPPCRNVSPRATSSGVAIN
jgi:hypothetical protein